LSWPRSMTSLEFEEWVCQSKSSQFINRFIHRSIHLSSIDFEYLVSSVSFRFVSFRFVSFRLIKRAHPSASHLWWDHIRSDQISKTGQGILFARIETNKQTNDNQPKSTIIGLPNEYHQHTSIQWYSFVTLPRRMRRGMALYGMPSAWHGMAPGWAYTALHCTALHNHWRNQSG